jgi:pyridoxamine 5'-phosphate oxidase
MSEDKILRDLATERRDYSGKELDEHSVEKDPITQFDTWYEEAKTCGIKDANAMALGTCGRDGRPSVRIVLLKGYGQKGFIFYTNYNSHKGQQIADNPYAALTFYWHELDRVVRIEGPVEKVSEKESDDYFQSRPHLSQIAALASPQSQPIAEAALISRFKTLQSELNNSVVQRPKHWGGFIVLPEMIEFWQGRPNRLHDRIQYCSLPDGWNIQRLAP